DEILQRFTDEDGEEQGGQGGPYLSVLPAEHYGNEFAGLTAPDAEDGLPGQFDLALLRLEDRLKRWTALNEVVARLPLLPPLLEIRSMSGFGKRRDPINGRWAVHE